MGELKKVGQFHSITIAQNANLNIGQWVEVRNFSSIEVFPNASLNLADGVFINEHCTLRCAKEISIGPYTMLGDGVRIYDQDHFFNNYTFSRRITQSEKVSIGERCWIGANSIITKGVKIGDNVIIGAGSVITKDIPSNTIVYGKKNLIIKNRPQAKYHALILTASEHLEHIAELLKALPKMDFHIAAYTDMGAGLMELHSYQNCQLYPKVHLDYSLKSLIEKVDIYLDINHGIELDNIVEQILSLEKPVLSFETTNHRPEDERIRSFEQADQMVIAIKEIIERKSKNK